MTISLIVAHDRNRLIGNSGDMPWGTSIKSDLQWFQQHTLHKTVLMGSKTYQSIGRKLPLRNNVVLTRNNSKRVVESYRAEDCFVVNSPEEFLSEWCMEDEECFIIGGSTVYNQFLPVADRLYITYIDAEFKGDTFFPKYDLYEYAIVYEKKTYDYYPLSFTIYERIKNIKYTIDT